jgi:hypothetical protein
VLLFFVWRVFKVDLKKSSANSSQVGKVDPVPAGSLALNLEKLRCLLKT